VIASGLVAMAFSLRCFADKALFHREMRGGPTIVAYGLGKFLSQLILIITYPFIFTCIYWYIVNHRASFWPFYLVNLGIFWATSPFGYIFTVVLKDKYAALAGSIAVLIMSLVAGVVPKYQAYKDAAETGFQFGIVRSLMQLSYAHAANAALYVQQVNEWADEFPESVRTSKEEFGFKSPDSIPDNAMFTYYMWALFNIGVILRIVVLCILILNAYGSYRKFFTTFYLRVRHSIVQENED
jgi:hypothetical protein